jgi:hypothetical protein
MLCHSLPILGFSSVEFDFTPSQLILNILFWVNTKHALLIFAIQLNLPFQFLSGQKKKTWLERERGVRDRIEELS